MIKIEIKSIYGSVLFSYEKENNTIKYTVEEAVRHNANLINADLRNANLINANLINANLINANLENVNLRNANLINANLINANLENANLENANLINANLINANLENVNLRNANLENVNLRNADLRNADLRNANLENANLPLFCKWYLGIKKDLIYIGCKSNTIAEWDVFFASDKVFSTERNTDDFKKIQACYEATKAYLLFLKK